MTVEATQKALYFIIGQDARMEYKQRGKTDVYHQDEDPYYEDDGGWDYNEDAVYYNDAGGTDGDTPWPDQGQDYYDEGEDQDPNTEVFDVEEFDEIYASYADAKAKLNAMRTSRGFFPVVALLDKGAGRSSSPGGKAGGKTRGKPKGKGKGKGKQLPKGSTAKQRGQAAIGGRQVCLRCGQSGHWARNCPNGSSDPKKRRIGDGDGDEVMMVAEVFAMDQDDMNEEEPMSHATQDGGASSVDPWQLSQCAVLRLVFPGAGLRPEQDRDLLLRQGLSLRQLRDRAGDYMHPPAGRSWRQEGEGPDLPHRWDGPDPLYWKTAAEETWHCSRLRQQYHAMAWLPLASTTSGPYKLRASTCWTWWRTRPCSSRRARPMPSTCPTTSRPTSTTRTLSPWTLSSP